MRAILPAAAALLALAPAAHGAQTIGSDLNARSFGVACPAGSSSCTVSQAVLPGTPVTAPIDGVVTRWSVKSVTGTVALRVLRQDAAGLRVVGASAGQAAPTTSVHTFTTQIPVASGDRVGLEVAPGALYGAVATPGAVLDVWSPPLGATAAPPQPGPADAELMLNVVIEADANRNGLGDESGEPQTPQPPPYPGRTVSVLDNRYSPRSTTVRRRSLVRWRWAGASSHSVTFSRVPRGARRGGSAIKRTGTLTKRMTRAGAYSYFCRVHGSAMRGAVRVR